MPVARWLASQPGLLLANSAPLHTRVPYISTGYRKQAESLGEALVSALGLVWLQSGGRKGGRWRWVLHNEMGNVWSHLLPAMLTPMLGLWHVCYWLPSLRAPPLRDDYLVSIAFFIGLWLCFACSAWYHTVRILPPRDAAVALGVDRAGILSVLGASLGLLAHYLLTDLGSGRFALVVAWLAAAVLVLGGLHLLGLVSLPVAASCRASSRTGCAWCDGTAVFVGLFLLALMGVASGCALAPDIGGLIWSHVSAMYAWYAFGVFFYVLRLPERMFAATAADDEYLHDFSHSVRVHARATLHAGTQKAWCV